MLRHRCKVMTLTPSVSAISPCSFPCAAICVACASLVATSSLECLFLAIEAVQPFPDLLLHPDRNSPVMGYFVRAMVSRRRRRRPRSERDGWRASEQDPQHGGSKGRQLPQSPLT